MGILDIKIDGVSSKLVDHPTVKKCPFTFYWANEPKEGYKALSKKGAEKLKITVKQNDDTGDGISVGKDTVIGDTVIGNRKLVLCVKEKPKKAKEEETEEETKEEKDKEEE